MLVTTLHVCQRIAMLHQVRLYSSLLERQAGGGGHREGGEARGRVGSRGRGGGGESSII